MAQATRTFRIFVSSTLHDLKEDRNQLHQKVFPRLRDLCVQLCLWGPCLLTRLLAEHGSPGASERAYIRHARLILQTAAAR